MKCEVFEARSLMPVSAELLFDWHASPGAFEALIPPWQRLVVERGPEGLRNGDRVLILVRLAPGIWKRWEAEHFGVIPGRRFCDRQLRGPFAEWTHTHEFVPHGEGRSELVDRVEWRPPFGPFGAWAKPLLRRKLRLLFEFRHAATRLHLATFAGGADGAAKSAR